MALNHPYDPRYNAKIYIPKLTEEQRLPWVTPLENLRGLRFRTETPAAPSPAEAVVPTPVPTPIATVNPPQPEAASPSQEQVAPAAPSLIEAAAPAPWSPPNTPDARYVPSAREVVFAEFPELYPERRGPVHGTTQRHELCLVCAAPTDDDPPCEPRCANKPQTRSRYVRPLHARVGEHEKSSASPLIQSFSFGSNPGAPPHSPPASKLRR